MTKAHLLSGWAFSISDNQCIAGRLSDHLHQFFLAQINFTAMPNCKGNNHQLLILNLTDNFYSPRHGSAITRPNPHVVAHRNVEGSCIRQYGLKASREGVFVPGGQVCVAAFQRNCQFQPSRPRSFLKSLSDFLSPVSARACRANSKSSLSSK